MSRSSITKLAWILVLALPALGARAEEPLRIGWRAGLRHTVLRNTTAVDTADVTGEGFVTGALGSVFVEASVGATRRGGTVGSTGTLIGVDGVSRQGPATRSVSFQTLQVPLLAGWSGGGERWRVHALAGVDFGILLSSTTDQGLSDESLSLHPSQLGDDLRSLTLGLAVGAGGVCSISRVLGLHLDLRYTGGVTEQARSGSALASSLGRGSDFRVQLGLSARL